MKTKHALRVSDVSSRRAACLQTQCSIPKLSNNISNNVVEDAGWCVTIGTCDLELCERS